MACTKGAFVRTQILVHSWGPRARNSALFRGVLFRLRRKLLLKVLNAGQHNSDLVFFKAVPCEGALRDDTKNGCAADQH